MIDIHSLTKDQLHVYLRTNKVELIAAKKQDIKFTDATSSKPIIAVREIKAVALKKAATSSEELHPEAVDVKVVCNTANFCDSHMDVLTSNCYTESVELKGITIPHIADHMQNSTAHVGDVTAVYIAELSLKELGLEQEGSTTALIMETTVRKDYNEDVFKFYKNGKINQHSIGLRYQEIKLALNSDDEDDKSEFAIWNEHYPSIANKELVDKRGYFWAVSKIDIIENSCVLFGANSLTPTLAIKSYPLKNELPEAVKGSITQNNFNNRSTTMSEVTLEKYVALQDELAALKESQTLAVASAVKTERNRCTKIMTSATTFNVKSETVAKAIDKGWQLDMVAEYFSDLAEAKDAETAVVTGAKSLDSADAITKAALADLASNQAKGEDQFIAGGNLSMGDLITAMSEIGGGK